jgi:sugar phosphate isomerase/epimerase
VSEPARSLLTAHRLAFIAALDFERMPAADVSATLLGSGYGAVEWTMAHVNELGRPATALACQQDFARGGTEALRRTLAAIEAAADAEIPVVDVLTGPNLWEEGPRPSYGEDAWSSALASLEAACRRGQELGVQVGFEPCWGTLAHDADTAQRVIDAVPVSVTFDPSHFVMSGDQIPALVRRWGDRIVNVHLKDAFGRAGLEGEDFQFCMLGEGRVPWAELAAALEDVGYGGPLAVEFEAYRYYEQVLGSDPEAAARLCRDQVEALLGDRLAVTS